MDSVTVRRWFDDYLEVFAAATRGDRPISELLQCYAVPLTITTDDGVVALTTAEQVAAVPVGERLRAALVAGRDRTVALAGTAAVAIKALEAPPWLTGVLARAQRP